MSTVHTPNDLSEFEELLNSDSNKLFVVDFYASWCGPCKMMAPKFAKMSIEFKDVSFVKVDVDECEDIVAGYEIKVMPTFIFIKNSKQIDCVEGSVEDQLRSKIANHK